MADRIELSSPDDFRSNFGGYINQIQRDLEALHGNDPGNFPTVVERAQAEAPFVAARKWLEARWGAHFACPVCSNVSWTVSEVGPADKPAGFLAFAVTCGYCGNTMQVVPGQAYLDAPIPSRQLEFPAGEA